MMLLNEMKGFLSYLRMESEPESRVIHIPVRKLGLAKAVYVARKS